MAFPQGQGVPTAMGVTPARPSNTGMSAGPSGMNPSPPPPGGGPAVIPPGPVPGVPMDAPPPPMTGQAVPMQQGAGRVYDINQDAPTDGGPGGGVMAQLEASGLSGQALMEALIGVLSQMGMSKVRFNGEEIPLGPGPMPGPGMGPGGPQLA